MKNVVLIIMLLGPCLYAQDDFDFDFDFDEESSYVPEDDYESEYDDEHLPHKENRGNGADTSKTQKDKKKGGPITWEEAKAPKPATEPTQIAFEQ